MRVMVTGHRPNKLGGHGSSPMRSWVVSSLRLVLEGLQRREAGVEVITGMALGVDQWWALEALALGIPVHAYLPCDQMDTVWWEESRRVFHDILAQCSTKRIVSPGPYVAWKMQQRNRAMVDAADLCVAVWDGTPGGTHNCVQYARKVELPIIRLEPKLRTMARL